MAARYWSKLAGAGAGVASSSSKLGPGSPASMRNSRSEKRVKPIGIASTIARDDLLHSIGDAGNDCGVSRLSGWQISNERSEGIRSGRGHCCGKDERFRDGCHIGNERRELFKVRGSTLHALAGGGVPSGGWLAAGRVRMRTAPAAAKMVVAITVKRFEDRAIVFTHVFQLCRCAVASDYKETEPV